MIKDYILVASTLILLAVTLHFGMMYSRALDQIEQMKSKNKLLQEENASLHDGVWSLHQKLMKESAEHERSN